MNKILLAIAFLAVGSLSLSLEAGRGRRGCRPCKKECPTKACPVKKACAPCAPKACKPCRTDECEKCVLPEPKCSRNETVTEECVAIPCTRKVVVDEPYTKFVKITRRCTESCNEQISQCPCDEEEVRAIQAKGGKVTEKAAFEAKAMESRNNAAQRVAGY